MSSLCSRQVRHLMLCVSASFGCLAGLASGSGAQDNSPVRKGELIAQRSCATCHAIATTGESTHKLAPPFRVLPLRYPVANLAEALAEGIVVSHKDMPQFTFDPDEIDALLAFIDALVPADAPGRKR